MSSIADEQHAPQTQTTVSKTAVSPRDAAAERVVVIPGNDNSIKYIELGIVTAEKRLQTIRRERNLPFEAVHSQAPYFYDRWEVWALHLHCAFGLKIAKAEWHAHARLFSSIQTRISVRV